MKERIWVRFSRLGKTARIKRGIVLGAEACISVICLVMAVVYGVNGDPYNRLFSCLMAGLLLWVPIIVERLAKHRFSFTQHAAFIILLAGGAVAGSVFYLFYLTDWFDCFMHVLAGYVLMIFLLTLQCRKLNEIENGGLSDRKSALSCTLTLFARVAGYGVPVGAGGVYRRYVLRADGAGRDSRRGAAGDSRAGIHGRARELGSHKIRERPGYGYGYALSRGRQYLILPALSYPRFYKEKSWHGHFYKGYRRHGNERLRLSGGNRLSVQRAAGGQCVPQAAKIYCCKY